MDSGLGSGPSRGGPGEIIAVPLFLVANNRLTGEIPAELGDLALLEHLFLRNNMLMEVRRWLDRLYRAIETSDLDITDIAPRIREHRERERKLQNAAREAEVTLSERRVRLDQVETITAFARDMGAYLQTSELTERRAFIESFVKEIVVGPGEAKVRYTIPISQSTQETELLLGGRSEEIRVGNEAEASSQLVWDVDGRLHPEEQPCAELWPSQQFLFPVDVFLQSLSSTPTVR